MEDMAARNVEQAYELISPRAQRQFTLSDADKLIQGNSYALLDGYQRLTVDNLTIKFESHTNQDLPQGMVATVSATPFYDGGYTGNLEATLEKVKGEWKIHDIQITVPPDKIKP